jgi:glycosyltransferase involved in cell wall biosynthesis/predicted SAM-dependent methyltransferase
MAVAVGKSGANQMGIGTRPRVSVILPTYNRASLLKYALDSVMSQTYRDLEVIVVDDGSTDKTAEIAESYSRGVRYFYIEHSGLPSVPRNAGLRLAQGDYVAFLDSDDEWLPVKLERQVEVLETHPAVGLVCSNALALEHGQSAPGRVYLRDDQGASGWVLAKLLADNFVITSTAVMRRSLLSRTGLFSQDPLLRALEDYDLWLRIATHGQIYYLPEALAIYRDDPVDSIRTKQSRSCHWQGMLLILDHVRRSLVDEGQPDLDPIRILEERAFAYRSALCDAYLAEGRFSDAIRCSIPLLEKAAARGMRLWYGRVARGLGGMSQAWLRAMRGWHSKESPIMAGKGPRGIGGDLKLHLGCGETYLPGYTNIDFPSEHHTVQRTSKADIHADIPELRYPPGSVEEIRLHHVFEHFDRGTAVRLLIEWYDWLKVGGMLVIETPDFEKCAQTFIRSSGEGDRLKVLRHIFGSHEAAWAVHLDGWYQAKFELFLGSLGYRDLFFSASEWRGTCNITVTARKLHPLMTRDEQVEAGKELLRLSLVDDSDSEERMIGVWMERVRRFGKGRNSQ